MKSQIFFIFLVLIVSCANANPFRYILDKFSNNRSVQSQEEVNLDKRITSQIDELTYGLMRRSSINAGGLFDAIQNDVLNISTKLINLKLNQEAENQLNNQVKDIQKFITTLSLALNKGLSKTLREVMKQLIIILPDIEKLINVLVETDIRIDNIIPNTFKEIKNYNLIKAILADLNPFNLLLSIRNSLINFSLNGIINNLISGFKFILNIIPNILTSLFNIGGLFDIAYNGFQSLIYLNRLGKQFNELSLNYDLIRNSNKNLFGNVRDRFNYVNNSL